MVRNDRLIVGVVMGGQSSEHRASLYSGRNVLAHIDFSQYDARPILINSTGTWFEERWPYRLWRDALMSSKSGKKLLGPILDSHSRFRKSDAENALKRVDIVFNALHGEYGEDGIFQKFLDNLGILYTGSRARAAALAMDKLRSRECFRGAGLSTPRTFLISDGFDKDVLQVWLNEFSTHEWILKPRSKGNSVGVRFASSDEELWALISNSDIRTDYLVEEYFHGIEVTCGVVDFGNGPRALQPVQIEKGNRRIFDEQMKYDRSSYQTIVPPQASSHSIHHIQESAVSAHVLLGCRVYSRTDFILVQGKPIILEVNSLPGLSPNSLYNLGLRASGIRLSSLVKHLIEVA